MPHLRSDGRTNSYRARFVRRPMTAEESERGRMVAAATADSRRAQEAADREFRARLMASERE